ATDVLAQSLIEQSLRRDQPDIAFVGEEGAAAAPSSAPRHWLVDPICGTGNFAAGIPLWAINVALVEDGAVTCAAMADGSTGDILLAERRAGAWRVTPEGYARVTASAWSGLLSVDPHSRGLDALARFNL